MTEPDSEQTQQDSIGSPNKATSDQKLTEEDGDQIDGEESNVETPKDNHGTIPSSPSNNETQSSTPATTNTMTKTQLKKLRKRQRIFEARKEKKRKKQQARREQAIAQGRDLQAEQRLMEERTQSGDRQRRLQEIWNEKMGKAKSRFQVCIDCSFENQMLEKEITSLTQQIRYCYSYNKNSPNPCLVSAVNIEQDSMTRKLLEKQTGFTTWQQKAFTCTEKSLMGYYGVPDDPSILSKMIYLTSDSSTELDHLNDNHIYIIGGIVDRNRLKGATLKQAEQLGIQTAKLPLDKYLKEMPSTKVLTCNHVFDLLLKYREYDNNWSLALQKVLPSRKEAKIQQQDSDATFNANNHNEAKNDVEPKGDKKEGSLHLSSRT